MAQVRNFIDKPFIKVVTGLRRSGKSAILALLIEELVEKGVAESNIIYLNFESFEFSDIDSSVKLYEFIKHRIKKDERYYVLLDEIQEVKAWEKAVNSFLVDFNVDIYITGSNSHLLSSELATYIAGRYVEIQISTLSFAEYLLFKQERIPEEALSLYMHFEGFLRMGGFPVLHTGDYTYETAYKVVYDIYSSAILRDTVQRYKIRDLELLERVVKYVFDNVGSLFSAKNVADYFKNQFRKIDLNTVHNYLNALEGAFIVHRISRYDIKGKEILKTQEKYFVGDQALLYSVMGFKDRMLSGVLENIVMLELKRRGYRVYVGKLNGTEVDFVAVKNGERVYVQVAYKMTEPSTIEREFKPLLQIRDNFPKYIVTMDELWKDNIDGIKHMHIADFLLMAVF
jgi:hypothetical protein